MNISRIKFSNYQYIALFIYFTANCTLCHPGNNDTLVRQRLRAIGLKNNRLGYFSSNELGKIEKQNNKKYSQLIQIVKKNGAVSFLRTKMKLHEWILYDETEQPQLPGLSDSEIKNISSVDDTDLNLTTNLNVHFQRWNHIFEYSNDSKVDMVKKKVMVELGFNDTKTLAKYIAVGFCLLPNIDHDFPADLVNFENEDEIINSAKQWDIDDEKILKAMRVVYRLSKL